MQGPRGPSTFSPRLQRAKRPSGEMATGACPCKVCRHLPVATSHSCSTSGSSFPTRFNNASLPDRAKRQSEENAMEPVQPACTSTVRRHCPVATSQNRTSSPLPERAKRPSREKVTQLTQDLCPSKLRFSHPPP